MKKPLSRCGWSLVLCVLLSSGLRSQSGWYPQVSGTTCNLYGAYFLSVEVFSPPLGFVVGDSGLILKTSDGGTSWRPINSGTTYALRAVWFREPDSGYVVGDHGTILRSTDSGETWIPQNSNVTVNLYSVTTTNPATSSKYAWIAGDSGTILYTSNRGRNWVVPFSGTGTEKTLWSIDAYSEFGELRLLYACGDRGTVISSPLLDWTPLPANPNYDYHCVVSVKDSVWAVGSKGSAFHSEDEGTSWYFDSTHVHTTLRSLFVSKPGYGTQFPPGLAWAVGDSGTIIHSTDNGRSWSQEASPTLNRLNGVVFVSGDIGWAVGDHGTILYTENAGRTEPLLSASPMEFGLVAVGAAKSANMRVSNNGAAPLPISSIISSNHEFAVAPVSDTIPPLSCHNFSVTFTPDAKGVQTTNFVFAHNGDISADTVFVKGTGSDLLMPSSWRWQNPLPQCNYQFDVKFIDAGVAVAVGDNGSIMRTTDGGISWDVENNAEQTSNYLKAVNFVDANSGMAVGAFGTILQTSDGGLHWAAQSSGTTLDLNGVAFTDANNGIAVGGDYPFPYPPVRTVNEGGGIFCTTDGGKTWTSQFESPDLLLFGVAYSDKNTVIACGYNRTAYLGSSILRSADGGYHWTNGVTMPTHGQVGIQLFGVCFATDNVGIAVGYSGVILRTTDAGLTWSTVPSGTGQTLYKVSFRDANVGTSVGEGGTILQTTDGGLTWTSQASSVSSYASLAGVSFGGGSIGIAVGGGLITFAKSRGTVLRTTDGGDSWNITTQIVSFRSLRGVSSYDALNTLVVGDSGTVLRTTDGGSSWASELSGTLFEISGIPFYGISHCSVNASTVVGGAGQIIHTTDGGSHWMSQKSGISTILRSVSFFDPTYGLAVGDSGAILGTTDGGTTWMNISYTNQIPLYGVLLSSRTRAVAVGACGTILSTTDGGVRWTAQISSSQCNLNGVFFVNADSGTAVGDNGTILHTTDGGLTWTGQQSGTINNLRNVVFSDALHGTVCGMSGTILHTTDGGANWIRQASGTNLDLLAVSCAGSEVCTAVGEYGTILHTTTGGVVSGFVQTMSAHIPERFALFQNFPNPFNPSTVIRYSSPVAGYVTLKVYDVLGRRVATLVDEAQTVGEHQVSWDGSCVAGNLSSGIYFCRITVDGLSSKAEHFSSVKKMLLLR